MSVGRQDGRGLRRGWTTGACATAAAAAAYCGLLTGRCPDPVTITLPRGETPSFALAEERIGRDSVTVGIVKDAGDDPDVTHGALIRATVRYGEPARGVTFRAGPGVGMVTRAGLPIPPGEPAINPVPRRMMTEAIVAIAAAHGAAADAVVEIAVPGGEDLARKTWNPRLGIAGGLSILGTTGIVVPFSCAAWIHSIYRGIDVARANGITHVAGSTGPTSEAAVAQHYGLPVIALIDMGDFAGGLLKYLRSHPVPRVTIAGGFAKLTKLAQGLLDLHSGRGEVDFAWLAARLAEAGAGADLVAAARDANTAKEVLDLARTMGIGLGDLVASRGVATARFVLGDAPVRVEVLVFDRAGRLVGSADG
jgi:cobalt-precorrin-5B (C1)-methyltransferase